MAATIGSLRECPRTCGTVETEDLHSRCCVSRCTQIADAELEGHFTAVKTRTMLPSLRLNLGQTVLRRRERSAVHLTHPGPGSYYTPTRPYTYAQTLPATLAFGLRRGGGPYIPILAGFLPSAGSHSTISRPSINTASSFVFEKRTSGL
jgi:hypothetical protein